MRFRPRISWFATENGKKFSLFGTAAAGVSAFLVNFLPNTLFLEQFKDFFQMYRLGEGVPVSDKVLLQADKVMDLLKTTEAEKKLIKYFTVYGFDANCIGSTYYLPGAYVGIPSSYEYDKVDDVPRGEISVQGQPIPITSRASQKLVEALVLSNEARMFAIGTKIQEARSQMVLFNSMFATSSVLLYYSFTHHINRKLNLFARPLALRVVIYSIAGAFCVGVWVLSKDVTTTSIENTTDEEVAQCSPELAKGGLEFYNKILQRNQALRELMGSDGEALLASSGNPQILFRTKHMPITQRRDNLQKIVENNK